MADAALLVRRARALVELGARLCPTVDKGDQLGAVGRVAVGHKRAVLGLLEGRGGERSRLRSCQLRFDEQRARLARLAEAASRGRVEDGSTAALQLHGHVRRERLPSRWQRQYSTNPIQPALQQYTRKTCCIGQYSDGALSRAQCKAIQQYSAIHRNTAIQQYSTIQYTAQYNPPQVGNARLCADSVSGSMKHLCKRRGNGYYSRPA